MSDILSVNFHLWQSCNMSCGYCFNSNRSRGAIPDESRQRDIVALLCQYGFSKISFVGGEPTLCPWLTDLACICKDRSVTTMLITNGKLLHKTDLSAFDWVGLSIDSFSQETCNSIGRDGELDYFKLSDLIRANKCRLKVNTVVSKLNMHEDFTSNIIHLAPERWKVMQVLEIKGQNDLNFERYAIDSDEFGDFVSRHRSITQLCSESNEAMRSSYLIVDHSGALLDNSSGEYRKSDSILDIGVERALEQIRFDYDKFIGRDALYDWR